MFTFATVDPRPASRTAELERLASMQALGIEVTVPELAQACSLGHIDPQHTGGDASTSAIEAALAAPIPPAGAVLVTVRPDADALGAMAVLSLRAARQMGPESPDQMLVRVRAIGLADRTGRGDLQDSRVYDTSVLKAIALDHRRDLVERVEVIRRWIVSGDRAGFDAVAEAIAADRREISSIPVTTLPGGLALVESTSRFAVEAGYRVAPVVVAVNPEFHFRGGPAHRKVTICQEAVGRVDLPAVWAELSRLEPGWGGSPTVGGSPQGISSELSVEAICEVVARHMSAEQPVEVVAATLDEDAPRPEGVEAVARLDRPQGDRVYIAAQEHGGSFDWDHELVWLDADGRIVARSGKVISLGEAMSDYMTSDDMSVIRSGRRPYAADVYPLMRVAKDADIHVRVPAETAAAVQVLGDRWGTARTMEAL